MMRICALAVLLAAAAANAEKPEWSKPNSRSDWIPVLPPRDLDVAAQEEVSTILRPPSENGFIRQTRLIQPPPPRQGRNEFGQPQPYFPGDQSHLVRFPGQPNIPLRGAPQPPPPNFIPNFRQPQQPPPAFLQQQQQQGPPPQFFNQPPQAPPQQFNQQPIPLRPQNQSFVPAGPQDEVQLVYVPVDALPPFQKGSNNVPVQQKPPPGQFIRQPPPQALPFGNQQNKFDQEQLRIAQLKEQEERQRIQEQELRERQEQETRIRQEAEEKQRQQQRQQQQQFRPPQSVTPSSNLKAQENLFQQRFPPTTELPTNPTPHQPPLAVYLTAGRPQKLTVDDVIASLKDATTIPVLDTVPDTRSPPPQIFVGPAEMTAPNGYSKFDLPYLNSLDTNRVERKVEQLPFFVAPLSYSPPQGYNKIPFPSPHIGSVVVAPGARHFNAAPAPAPVNEPIEQHNQFASNEQISPAIPLLVNSLQAGGQRQKFPQQHPQQQTFPPPPPPAQRFPPPPPALQRFPQIQPDQPQFIYRDEQTFAQPPPPPQAPPAFVRHQNRPPSRQPPQHVEQFIRQEVTPAHHFAPPQQPQFIPEQQPEFIPSHQFQFSEPAPAAPEIQQFENEVQTEAPEPVTTTTTTEAPQRPATRVRTRPPAPSTTAAPRTRAPVRNFDDNGERRPVNRGRRPVQRLRTTTPEPEVEEQQEEQYIDVPKENSIRQQENLAPNYPLPPSQLSPFSDSQRFAQIPVRQHQFHAQPQFPAFQGQFEHSFRALPSPTPQIGVTYSHNGAPENHRDVDLPQSVSPSTINYPTPSPALDPELSVKGDFGQVQHSPSPTPFAPTPVPVTATTFAPVTRDEYLTASPVVNNVVEEVVTTAIPEVISEVPSTEEPKRTRQRIPEGVSVNSTPRPRARVTADGQRFRARPLASRDENQEEPQHNTQQRPRGRQVVRVRTTTEAAAVEGENAPERDVTRTRTRFRAIDRTRVGARQQQVVRSRQPVQQQEDIELAKPVRNGPSTERIVSDSPVFVSENESDSDAATERSTTEAATTQKPGRRFNNFGVGQRTRRIRPVANQEQSDAAGTTVQPPRNHVTARPSRRQQPTASPIARSTLRGGARLRKPITTEAPEAEEAAVETGVTYSKNPYVSIQRGEKAEETPAEEPTAPVPAKRVNKNQSTEQFIRQSVTPAAPRENYPPNFNFEEEEQDTVVYRPRVRVPNRNRFRQQEDPEFNVEESQRSEQISIQQLDDAVSLLKTYYNTKYNDDVPSEVDEIGFTEEPSSTDPAFEQSTEQRVETTEPVPTNIPEEAEVAVTTIPEEPKVEKFSSKIKVSEPKRRLRIKKRPVGDVFETAESQNIASAANSFSKGTDKAEKESKPAEPKGHRVTESHASADTEKVHFTTTTTTTTEAPAVATTVEEANTETTPATPEELTTVEGVATTPVEDEEATTEPDSIILGTSTTTEISLETEICYKGRCIKTKVDADQVPIE